MGVTMLRLSLVVLLVASPALAQSDCAATRLGQIGCEPGQNRSGDPSPGLRSWSSPEPEPDQGYYGAQPFDARRPLSDPAPFGSLRGGNSNGCGTILSGPCTN